MKFLLADHDNLCRQGLATMLESTFPACRIYHSNCWQAVHQCLENQKFDLILLDFFMPGCWKEELKALCQNNSSYMICIVSISHEKEHMQIAFDFGVKGYICKTAELPEIKHALLQVQQGKFYFPPQIWETSLSPKNVVASNPLTLRQQKILSLIAKGNTNKMIAEKLNLTESTVKRHVYNICQALKARNRGEAVSLAYEQGWISRPY